MPSATGKNFLPCFQLSLLTQWFLDMMRFPSCYGKKELSLQWQAKKQEFWCARWAVQQVPTVSTLTFSHQEASKGDLSEVKRLVENGIAVNASDNDGRTALVNIVWSQSKFWNNFLFLQHLAASEGNRILVEFLLEKNADVNQR